MRSDLQTFRLIERELWRVAISKRVLRKFSAYRLILYGNRTAAGARRTKIFMSVHVTCEQYGVNFYRFVQDCLTDRAKTIPPRVVAIQMPAAV